MSMKEVKILKKDQKEVTVKNVTVKLTKGYAYQITKDKEGKPLETPITRYNAVESYFVDEDNNEYYQRNGKDEISYKKCKIIDVCVITTVKKDESVVTRVMATPTYLLNVSEATLADFVDFKLR